MPFNPLPVEILRTLPFLCSLGDREFTWLLPAIQRRAFLAGTCVLRAGEPAEGLYILINGRVQLVHQDQEGRALIAETFGPGELFGELGLIDATACPASVVATKNCEVVFIAREPALQCLKTSAGAAMSMLRTSLERLCKAHRQMSDLALTKVYGRVAKVLAAHGHEAYGEWHVDVGSQQIAGMVGASREMVSRVLRCMIQKRVIRRFKRKLIVVNRDALRAPEL